MVPRQQLAPRPQVALEEPVDGFVVGIQVQAAHGRDLGSGCGDTVAAELRGKDATLRPPVSA
ncbi:MAG: hypothetical protein AB7O38_28770 [Pirellulaceae bacterium]